MANKPMPKLGQTRAIMDEFVRTGKLPESPEIDERPLTSPAPANLGSKVPRSQGSKVDGEPFSELLSDERRKADTRTITRSYDIPYKLSRRLRRCVYREEVTATSIVVEALTKWLDEYERRFGGVDE